MKIKISGKFIFWEMFGIIVAVILAISLFAGYTAKQKAEQLESFEKLNWIIPLGTYEEIYPLAGRSDSYVIKQDGKYGFLTERGITACRYDEIKPFTQEALYPARLQYKWGYVNEKGEEVIGLAYEDAEPFVGNYAAVRQGELSMVIDQSGKVCYQTSRGGLYSTEKEGYFQILQGRAGEGPVVDVKTGEEVAGGQWFESIDYAEGFWLARPVGKKGTLPDEGIIYMDENFRKVYGPFADGNPFSEGYALVQDNDAYDYYYMNRKGALEIGPLDSREGAETYGSFFGGLAFYDTGKLIDQGGNIHAEISWDGALYPGYTWDDRPAGFSEGWMAVETEDARYGFADTRGNWVVEPVFDRVICNLRDGRAGVVFSNMWGVIGKEEEHDSQSSTD